MVSKRGGTFRGVRGVAACFLAGIGTLTGCDAFSAPPDDQASATSAPDHSLLLLRGRETQLRLETNGALLSGPAQAHLSEQIRTLLNVSVSEGSGLTIENADASGATWFQANITGARVGVFELVLRYLDPLNAEHVDTFAVEVAELHHTEVGIRCWNQRQSGEALLMAPGVPVGFDAKAIDAQGRTLVLHDPDFVLDYAGFDSQTVSERLAPEQPGRYEWKLAGAEARTVAFEVYDPQKLEPELDDSPDRVDPLHVVAVDALFDDRAVCTYPSGLYVDFEVESGSCQPSLEGLEFPDGVSFPIGWKVGHTTVQPDDVHFSGDGTCRVTATLSTGNSTDVEFDVRSEVNTAKPVAGRELSADAAELTPLGAQVPVETFEDCPNISVTTDGDCDTLFKADGDIDEDCLTGIDWRYELLEPGDDEPLQGWTMGIGLQARLRLGVDLKALGFILQEAQAPSRLRLDLEPSSGLELEDLGCSTRWHNFDVLPSEAADYVLEADASNAFNARKLYLSVREVARTSLDELDSGPPLPLHSTAAVVERDGYSLRHQFTRHQQTFRLQYFDAVGALLRGIAPLIATAEDPTAVLGTRDRTSIGWWRLDSGDVANHIELSSPVTDWRHVIEVETAAGIAAIDGVESATVPPLGEVCVFPQPLAEDGLRIFGVSPVRPQVRDVRGKVVVSKWWRNNDVCFRLVEPGSVELDWSWGDATKRTTWTSE